MIRTKKKIDYPAKTTRENKFYGKRNEWGKFSNT